MGSVAALRPSGQRRSVGIAVGVALLLVVLVVAIAFVNSVGASKVAGNARALHWTNASLGTSAVARLALVQASNFVELNQTGQATAADVDFAMDQVRGARDELAHLVETGEVSGSLPSLTRFLTAADDTIAALEGGRTGASHRLIMGELESSYVELVDTLQAEQIEILRQIDANTNTASRATGLIQFFVMFAIPASGVLIYRYLARRALREFQMKADLMVQSERAIGRAKDEFIAGLSHELRTPLTSIYGFAEVMSDDADVPEDSRELAGIVANEASEMTRMVDDLLAAARLDSTGVEVELVPTSVRAVVDGALAPFARAGVVVPVRGDDAMVKTDPARLRQVIVNLVSNAVKHGGPQVGIEISESTEAGVDIEVWDNGQGVPEERLGSLFKRFAHDGSTPLLTGSLGLGLAVAGRLASLIGGKLDYQRFSGKTYFIVTLPTAATRSQPSQGPDTEETVVKQESVADVIRALSA